MHAERARSPLALRSSVPQCPHASGCASDDRPACLSLSLNNAVGIVITTGPPMHQKPRPSNLSGLTTHEAAAGTVTSSTTSQQFRGGVCVFERHGGRATGQGLPGRRYFTVPRPLLQSIVATTGTTPAVFTRGSSINVAAQLTTLTNSAPALAPGSQLGGGQLQQVAQLPNPELQSHHAQGFHMELFSCSHVAGDILVVPPTGAHAHKHACVPLGGKRSSRHVSTAMANAGASEAVRVCAAEQTIAMINPGFSTHNVQMSQRYVVLSSTCPTPTARAGAHH